MDLRELFNFSKNAVVAEECEYVLQDYFENYNRPAGTIRGHSGRYPEKLPPYVDILKDAVETYEELLVVFPNDKWQQRHDTLRSLLVVERNRTMEETMHQASVDAVVEFIQTHRSKRIVPVEKDDDRVVSALNSYAKYAEGDDVIGMVDMKRFFSKEPRGILFTKKGIYSSCLENIPCVEYKHIAFVQFEKFVVIIGMSGGRKLSIDFNKANADVVALLKGMLAARTKVRLTYNIK